jgi:general secretion pathway protein K
MRQRRSSWIHDRGAALVTVLTTLALMSTLAIVVVDAANMSLRRTANLVRMEQTRWYLMGAEAFATARLGDLRRRAETTRIDSEEWHGRPFVFALDDGVMEVTVVDGANCFNLNSVVQANAGSGAYSLNTQGMFQLARLLDLTGARGAQVGLAAALADWIDSDVSVTAGGAEDASYGLDGGYTTANTLIGDVSELRNVRGFDAATIQRIAPYICVRASSAPNLVNPNTLTPDQAPLLAMLIPGLSIDTARQIIRDRPRGGWEDVDTFLRHPRINSEDINDATRAQFSMQSRYYVLYVSVQRDGASESGMALIDSAGGGDGVVVRRVFGLGAPGQLL